MLAGTITKMKIKICDESQTWSGNIIESELFFDSPSIFSISRSWRRNNMHSAVFNFNYDSLSWKNNFPYSIQFVKK